MLIFNTIFDRCIYCCLFFYFKINFWHIICSLIGWHSSRVVSHREYNVWWRSKTETLCLNFFFHKVEVKTEHWTSTWLHKFIKHVLTVSHELTVSKKLSKTLWSFFHICYYISLSCLIDHSLTVCTSVVWIFGKNMNIYSQISLYMHLTIV